MQGFQGLPACRDRLTPGIVLYPSNIFTPGVSTINFTSGVSHLRNGAWVMLSPTTPDFSALYSWTAGTSVHAYFDVYGYFKSDAPLKYYPITPAGRRTAPPSRTARRRRSRFRGTAASPVGAKAALVHLVVSSSGTDGDLTIYPSGQLVPSIRRSSSRPTS